MILQTVIKVPGTSTLKIGSKTYSRPTMNEVIAYVYTDSMLNAIRRLEALSESSKISYGDLTELQEFNDIIIEDKSVITNLFLIKYKDAASKLITCNTTEFTKNVIPSNYLVNARSVELFTEHCIIISDETP